MAFRVLDHTADVMLEITASSEEELFVEATPALFSILTDIESIGAKERVPVIVEADGIEQLLVSWLNELLFLYESQQWLFRTASIRRLTGERVEGEALGEKLDPDRHKIDREIKAVTYHQLKVERREGGLATRIVLDL